MTLGIEREGLAEPLRELAARGLPVLGSCAGLIMLDRDHLGVMDMRAERNAFGRQISSFEADVDAARARRRRRSAAIFIRAPWIAEHGPDVEILGEVDGHPVAARQGRMLAVAFHAELGDDDRLHRLFLERVRERGACATARGGARAADARRGVRGRADRGRRRARARAGAPRARGARARRARATASARTGRGPRRRRRATSPRGAPSRRSSAAGPAPARRSPPTRSTACARRCAPTPPPPRARGAGTTPTCSRSACARPREARARGDPRRVVRRRAERRRRGPANVEHLAEIERES